MTSAQSSRLVSKLPCQVAAVCYRRNSSGIEFLLVNTDGGKWTFPKGAIEPHLSHSQAAANEALEEAGAVGIIEPADFHVYLHCKGVFWRRPGVREFAVKAFLMQVRQLSAPQEPQRNPTWFDPEAAKIALRHRREIKYGNEFIGLIDAALREILRQQPQGVPTGACVLPATTLTVQKQCRR